MVEKPVFALSAAAAAAAAGIDGAGECCYALLASEALAVTRRSIISYPVEDREETQVIENQPWPENLYLLAIRVI
jgi:hypothetical protein